MSEREQNRERLLDGLKDTVFQVMETMAFTDVSLTGADALPQFTLGNGVCGLIRLHGRHDGIIGISVDQRLGAEMISRITGLPANELGQEDLLDGIAEMANMICGGMKTKAAIGGIDLSSPMAILGQDFTAQWKSAYPTQVFTFDLGGETFRVLASC